MFILPNLISTGVTRGEPWKFKGEVPPEVRKDKAARDAWINAPATQWSVYSFVEGLNENRRITLGKGDADDANPPYRLHAFTGDYDAPISDADCLKALEGFSYAPKYVERTLSGNLRLIWMFEEPILIPSAKFGRYFQERVLEFFKAGKLLPGFDKGAWVELNRYYTNSGEWKETDAKPIPADRLRGWMVQIGAKFDWVKESGAVEIPFEALRPALAKKYPRFAEWPGEFALDEQGPSFWIDDSASPKSALVKPTGIQTFSAHAAKGFYTWADLLGLTFVQEYQADQMGRAVAGIFHDGKQYYRKLNGGTWRSFDKHDTRDFLRISRGVSKKCDKEGISDLDRALLYIQGEQHIDAAGAFVFKPSGVVPYKGKRLLNTSTCKVIQPSSEKPIWGPNGNMRLFTTFIDGFFDLIDRQRALQAFLAWLAIYYRSGYYQDPQSGQNVFICGGVGVGKTLLNGEIIGALVGGSGQAQQFLLGNDSFGGELFGCPHWMVDDAVFSTAERTKRKFAEMLKNMAASSEHRYHEKFKMPCFVEWLGRIVVTCNADPESIRAIPELSGSILDKLMLFRAVEKTNFVFPSKKEIRKQLSVELPIIARFLLEHEIPSYLQGESRWAIQPYHEKSLLNTAEKGSYTSGFLDILNDWKEQFFGADQPKASHWEGTSFQLQKGIMADPRTHQAMRSYDVNAITRQLISLQKKGHNIESIDTGNESSFRWRIHKKDRDSQAKYEAMNSDSH